MNKTKHPGGRPRKYQTAEELQIAIDAYFKKCDKTIITIQHAHSKGITRVETPTPYTMAGLAYALEIDRRTLINYKNTDEFFPLIMRARDKIEQDNVTKGLAGVYESRINTLNLASNYGYATKNETDISGSLSIEDKLAALRGDKG